MLLASPHLQFLELVKSFEAIELSEIIPSPICRLVQ